MGARGEGKHTLNLKSTSHPSSTLSQTVVRPQLRNRPALYRQKSTQHGVRHIMSSSVVCPALRYFFILSHKRRDFRKKKLFDIKCVFLFSLQLLSETFLIRRRINPLNAELNPICHLLALLGAHHILHVNRMRVKRHIVIIVCRYSCKGTRYSCHI